MKNIDINKIAVNFDYENTTKELFDSVVGKLVELGYRGSLKDLNFEDLRHWSTMFIDEEDDLLQGKSWSAGLADYTIMSPQEFLALCDTPEEQAKDPEQVVIEWLDKLYYVMCNDNSVHEQLYLNSNGLVLATDLCDVHGSVDVYNFVDGLYGEMRSKAEIKHKEELQSRRQKLMDELSEIDQQLGLYE